MNKKLFAMILVGVAWLSTSVQAQTWIIPTSVTATSQNSPDWVATHLIDGSGLSAENISGIHSRQDGFSVTNFFYSSGFGAAPGFNVTFDLGDTNNLNRMYLWNYGNTFPASYNGEQGALKDFQIYVSPDASGETFTQYGGWFTATHDPDNLVDAFQTSIYAQTFNLAAENVRRVRLAIGNDGVGLFQTSGGLTHPGVWGSGDQYFVHIGEVRFETVPEPSAALLLLAGGFLVWRRKS